MRLVHEGALPLAVLVERLTIGPVRALALDRRVAEIGTLREGAPADIAIIDPDAEWTVEPERFASKGRNTPLAGVRLRGRVVATLAGGRLVHDAREVAVA
jgi:dihydroorotase